MAHSIVIVQAHKATQPGALDGHEAICSCGYVMRTSLSAFFAADDGRKHAEYMNAKAGQ
jgi:hypothetical protein